MHEENHPASIVVLTMLFGTIALTMLPCTTLAIMIYNQQSSFKFQVPTL